jgi:hypothetical protein
MIFGTWNVLTLRQTGKVQDLMHEAEKYGVDVLALQEIRWDDTGSTKFRNFTLFWSGGVSGKGYEFGTGFLVNNKLLHLVKSFDAIDRYICKIRLKGRYRNITLVCAHAPHEGIGDDLKDDFYDRLEAVYDSIAQYDTKILLGDFNAVVGKEEYYRPAIDMHSLHNTSSDNGIRLIDFCTAKDLKICGTHFPHKSIHQITHKSERQIDHVLIENRDLKSLLDVRSFRQASIGSDHYLVRARFSARLPKKPKRNNCEERKKFNLTKLQDPSIAAEYRETLDAKLQACGSTRDINESWHNIKTAIIETANEILGEAPRNKINEWYDEECKERAEIRREAERNLHNPSLRTRAQKREAEEKFREINRQTNHFFRQKKREHIKGIVEKIQTAAEIKDPKSMYRTIRQVKGGFKQRTTFVKDKRGLLLSDPTEMAERWREYFEELLSDQTENSSPTINSPLETDLDELPSLEEVKEALAHLKRNKACGEDQIPAELLQHGGDHFCKEIHRVLTEIWKQEKMPDEWKTGIITVLHKKGDACVCENYRGLSLLNTAYKIFSRILFVRIEEAINSICGEYQAGFRKNRSTADHLFTIRQIIQKCNEYGIDVHILFIDFKKAYDSIKHEYIWRALEELGLSQKFIRLVKITLMGANAKVNFGGTTSSSFPVNVGLRQGDGLSVLLFNLVLEHIMRKVLTQEQMKRTLYTSKFQALAYADDIAFLARSLADLKILLLNLIKHAKEAGLQINEEKTMYLLVSRNKRPGHPSQNLTIDSYNFERVDQFKYLGGIITSENDSTPAVRERIAAGNRCLFGLAHIFRSKYVTANTKVQIYKTALRPVVTYGLETCTLTQQDEKDLEVFERKVLRKIFGAIKENQQWRKLYNHEIQELYRQPSITNYVRAQRLLWVGHVLRMEENRVPRKCFQSTPDGTRPRGRPKARFNDLIDRDVKQFNLVRWREVAMNTNLWKKHIWEAYHRQM